MVNLSYLLVYVTMDVGHLVHRKSTSLLDSPAMQYIKLIHMYALVVGLLNIQAILTKSFV